MPEIPSYLNGPNRPEERIGDANSTHIIHYNAEK